MNVYVHAHIIWGYVFIHAVLAFTNRQNKTLNTVAARTITAIIYTCTSSLSIYLSMLILQIDLIVALKITCIAFKNIVLLI